MTFFTGRAAIHVLLEQLKHGDDFSLGPRTAEPHRCCSASRHTGPQCHPQQSRHLHPTSGAAQQRGGCVARRRRVLPSLSPFATPLPVPMGTASPVGHLAAGRPLSWDSNSANDICRQRREARPPCCIPCSAERAKPARCSTGQDPGCHLAMHVTSP